MLAAPAIFSAAAYAQVGANPRAPAVAPVTVANPPTASLLTVAGYDDRNLWAAAAGGPITLVTFDTLVDGSQTNGTGALVPWGISDTTGSSVLSTPPISQHAYCSCTLPFPMFTAGTLPTEPNYIANQRNAPDYSCGKLKFTFVNPTKACGAFVADSSPLGGFTIEVFDTGGASLGSISVAPRTLPSSFVGIVSTVAFASAEFRGDSDFDSWGLDNVEHVSGNTPPTAFCTAGTTTNGCTASIGANANPSVSFANACNVSITGVEGQKNGIVFYGLAQLPQAWCSMGGGTSFLCVKPPTQRAVTVSSGGAINQCNGTLGLDWNAFQQANPSALGNPWSAGTKVYVQGWFRDPPACKTTSLSNALELTYQP
jgi:hypothetical protein